MPRIVMAIHQKMAMSKFAPKMLIDLPNSESSTS